jgi:hypothetical protein
VNPFADYISLHIILKSTNPRVQYLDDLLAKCTQRFTSIFEIDIYKITISDFFGMTFR